jgi:hypothetical protein
LYLDAKVKHDRRELILHSRFIVIGGEHTHCKDDISTIEGRPKRNCNPVQMSPEETARNQ